MANGIRFLAKDMYVWTWKLFLLTNEWSSESHISWPLHLPVQSNAERRPSHVFLSIYLSNTWDEFQDRNVRTFWNLEWNWRSQAFPENRAHIWPTLKDCFFCDIRTCIPWKFKRRFGRTYRIRLQNRRISQETSMTQVASIRAIAYLSTLKR